MSDRFNPLDSGEVISIQKDSQVLVGHRIFRVSELNDAIANHLKNAVDTWTDDKSNWFNTQGIDCEALRFGSSAWQKGKIRLCLEFCPDPIGIMEFNLQFPGSRFALLLQYSNSLISPV